MLFHIPPGEIDERMSGREAAEVLDYLAQHPETAEVIDIQTARLIQIFSGEKDFKSLRVRGRTKTEEEIADDWVRWIDERENRTTN